MRIAVDAEACVGSGLCALATPEVFDQDDTDGSVVLLAAEPPPGFFDAVRDAIESCPVKAISMAGHQE
jgi:ferredoxin